jgi:hypothetical protein
MTKITGAQGTFLLTLKGLKLAEIELPTLNIQNGAQTCF